MLMGRGASSRCWLTCPREAWLRSFLCVPAGDGVGYPIRSSFFGEFVDAVATELSTETGSFDAADKQFGAFDTDRVDEHQSGFDRVGDVVSLAGVGCVEVGAEAEGSVGQFDGPVFTVHLVDGGDWPASAYSGAAAHQPADLCRQGSVRWAQSFCAVHKKRPGCRNRSDQTICLLVPRRS